MINGLVISQLIGTNVQGEGTVDQPSATIQPGGSFQSLLGSMITASRPSTGNPAGTVSPAAAISHLSADSAIPAGYFSGATAGAESQSVPQPILQLIEFLNQASGEQHVPLNIIINLQDLSAEQLDSLESLGLNLSDSLTTVTAVLNADELEKLTNRISAGGEEIEIPVNAVFNDKGELLAGISALNATLSIVASDDVAGTSSDRPALTFQLNLFADRTSEPGTAGLVDAAEAESAAPAAGAAGWSMELTRVVEHLRSLLTGTTAGASVGSVSDLDEYPVLDNNEPPVDQPAFVGDAGIVQSADNPLDKKPGGDVENKPSMIAGQSESESEGLAAQAGPSELEAEDLAVRTGKIISQTADPALEGLVGAVETEVAQAPVDAEPPEETSVAQAPAAGGDLAAGFEPSIELNTPETQKNANSPDQEMLAVLAALVGTGLEQATELGDPGKGSRILSLLESLSGLEDLPAEDQLKAVKSLIAALEGLVPDNQDQISLPQAKTEPLPAEPEKPELSYPDQGTGGTAALVAEPAPISVTEPSVVEAVRPAEIQTPGSGEKTQPIPGLPEQSAGVQIKSVVHRLVELVRLISASPIHKEGEPASSSTPTQASGQVSMESELRAVADAAGKLSEVIESVLSRENPGTGTAVLTQAGDSTPEPARQSDRPLVRLTALIAEMISESPRPAGTVNSMPASAGNAAAAPAMESPVTTDKPDLAGITPVERPAQQTAPAADAVFTTSEETPTVNSREQAVQPKPAASTGGNAAAGQLNIKVKADKPTENQPAPIDGKPEQPTLQPKKSPGYSVKSDHSVNTGKSGSAAESAGTPLPEKDPLLSIRNRPEEEKAVRLSIPVRIEEQKPVSTGPKSVDRREAVMVYASQVQGDKADKISEQVKTVNRPGVENSSNTDILNGVIESLQGKGGGLKDSGGYQNQQELAAFKAELVHQNMPHESNNFRLSGLKGEQAPQPNSSPLFTNQSEMIGKITQAVRLTTSPGTSEISLRLEPDHLGQMRIRLSVDENQSVNARIQVETHEARSLIEGSLQRLRDSLAEQGFKVEKFNVDVRQEQNPQQQQQQQSASTGRDNFSRNRGGYYSGDEPASDRREFPYAAEEKTASVRKFGYNTLEWVA